MFARLKKTRSCELCGSNILVGVVNSKFLRRTNASNKLLCTHSIYRIKDAEPEVSIACIGIPRCVTLIPMHHGFFACFSVTLT